MTRVRAPRALAVLAAFAAGAVGCNAVFGITDVYLVEDGSDGASGADGAPEATAESAAPDATAEGGGALDGAAQDGGDASSGDAGDAPGDASVDAPADARGDGATGDAGPQLFATNFYNGTRLASDGTNLYFTRSAGLPNGGVFKCPLSGCPAAGPTLLAGNQNVPSAVAVSGADVYWANAGQQNTQNGAIYACTLTAGGCSSPRLLAQGQDSPSALVVAAGYVHWTNQGAFASATGSVARCATGGCSLTPTVEAAGRYLPTSVDGEGALVFWTNYLSDTVEGCSATSCDGGYTLATGQWAADDIRCAQGNLVWLQRIIGSGKVMTCPYADCGAPTALYAVPSTDGGLYPTSAVTDATRVYFLVGADANPFLAMCPLSTGCGGVQLPFLTTLALVEATPERMLLIGRRLFWSSSMGSIFTMTIP